MAYWYFDTNAISCLNDLRQTYGIEVIKRFLGQNSLLITRRNYHEIRMGKIESRRLIDLSREVPVFQHDADTEMLWEIESVFGGRLEQKKIHQLLPENIEFIVNSGVLEQFEVNVKSEMYQRYLWSVEEDRKIINDERMALAGVYLGIKKLCESHGFQFDPLLVSYQNFPSTYICNFVRYFWFIRNKDKRVTENDFYDLINSGTAPLTKRFYCERGLLQALKSIKIMNPPTIYQMFKYLYKQSGQSNKSLYSFNRPELKNQQPMLQDTDLFNVTQLRQHVLEFA